MMICPKCGGTQFQMLDGHYYLKCFSCTLLIDIMPAAAMTYNERPIEPKAPAVPRCHTELWIKANVAIIEQMRADGRSWESINVTVAKLSGIKTKRHIVAKYSQIEGIE